MAENATLARPYANAAFDLAKSHRSLPRWSRMLGLLGAAVQTAEVRALIGTPSLGDEVKAHRLIDLVRDELDDRGRRFVQVLAENKRLELLPEIAAQYEARKAEAERVLDVEIVAAAKPSDDQIEAYRQGLAARFEQQVSVTVSVDPSLLGGAVLRAGDTVIDGSVRGRLARLADGLRRG